MALLPATTYSVVSQDVLSFARRASNELSRSGPDAGPALQPYSWSLYPREYGLSLEQLPESEKEREKQKRKEINKVAQREFRQRNKFKIKELQEKLENLSREVRSLRDDNARLKTERDALDEKIMTLNKENEDLRSSLGSSPASEAEISWYSLEQ